MRNFAFILNRQKMSEFPNKRVYVSNYRWDEKGMGTSITKLLRIGLKLMILPMVYKSNNSCISKTHILSFMTPTLFARFLRDFFIATLEIIPTTEMSQKSPLYLISTFWPY